MRTPMFRTATAILFASALSAQAADLESAGRPIPALPNAPGRVDHVYVETAPAPPAPPQVVTAGPGGMVTFGTETWVTVTGLDGRLMVSPEVLGELGLRSGQEVSTEVMYKILEHNRKLY